MESVDVTEGEHLPTVVEEVIDAEIVINNPYWDEVKDHVHGDSFWGATVGGDYLSRPVGDLGMFSRRADFVCKYSWSIPNPGAIAFVLEHCRGRVVDPMAGTGYWMYMLFQLGVDVICYDHKAGQKTRHHNAEEFMPVIQGYCNETVMRHSDRTLFLSWPPYDDPAGYYALKNYAGARVIYIGEGDGGCTGDEKFHKLLEDSWEEVACHSIMQWWGIHDHIYVYDRKAINP